MLRRCFGAALVLVVLGGFVVAETYRGVLTKIEDGKLTFKTRSKEDKKGTDKTIKLSKDAKFIIKAKSEDEKDKEAKLEDVKALIEKAAKSKDKGGKGKRGGRGGVFASIETSGEGDAETVTKVTIGGGRGKGKRNKDK
jgi:hypothetical protein